ncbi:hypothetical protein [Aporhodopirellula aestuarii]|uniref:Uncharacterized protein n=1 Tax=Aporhodopirellula aestuarii TaxID=2950107 RepID=A0ABT0U838_9BACT|nr:hypothetical protein [Aporhodopirellula aestuarii]MCM2372849.1 hypothetical protein [Aporhodopirellula aestuarii]
MPPIDILPVTKKKVPLFGGMARRYSISGKQARCAAWKKAICGDFCVDTSGVNAAADARDAG